jgi:hypothetical protein
MLVEEAASGCLSDAVLRVVENSSSERSRSSNTSFASSLFRWTNERIARSRIYVESSARSAISLAAAATTEVSRARVASEIFAAWSATRST